MFDKESVKIKQLCVSFFPPVTSNGIRFFPDKDNIFKNETNDKQKKKQILKYKKNTPVSEFCMFFQTIILPPRKLHQLFQKEYIISEVQQLKKTKQNKMLLLLSPFIFKRIYCCVFDVALPTNPFPRHPHPPLPTSPYFWTNI